MRKRDIAFGAAVSLFAFYAGNKAALAYLGSYGGPLARLGGLPSAFLEEAAGRPFYISLGSLELLCGAALAAVSLLAYIAQSFFSAPLMPGKEHGTAYWGKPGDIRPFKSPKPYENLLLTKTEKLSIGSFKKSFFSDNYRNANALCVGGSGSGKTRYFIVPNILQMSASYVITDPKGELFRDCAVALEEAGYDVSVFSLVDMESSGTYNPFAYIETEADIIKLAANLIANTTDKAKTGGDDFWQKSEMALLTAIFAYIHWEAPEEDRNMGSVMDMLEGARTEGDEDDSSLKSGLDVMFDSLAEKQPSHFAVRQYAIYRQAAGKTLKSINVSVGVRMQMFNIDAVRRLTADDTLELHRIGQSKAALFVVIPDTDTSLNFIAAMMFQQLFDTLVRQADGIYKGRLPVPVMMMLDEFANIGQIPMFDVLVSTVRSRGISVVIAVQNLAQLKKAYKDTWATIAGNCDSLLFLGSNDLETLKYVSEMCGKATIGKKSVSESKGGTESSSVQNASLARDLIAPDEAGRLGGKECILKIRGLPPFRSKKYPLSRHPEYRRLESAKGKALKGRDAAPGFLKGLKAVVSGDYDDAGYYDFE